MYHILKQFNKKSLTLSAYFLISIFSQYFLQNSNNILYQFFLLGRFLIYFIDRLRKIFIFLLSFFDDLAIFINLFFYNFQILLQFLLIILKLNHINFTIFQ